MAEAVTDLAERNARLWEAVRIMIRRYGRDWRDHMDSIECEAVRELLAPLGTIEDWASRALDEAEKARLAGDRFTEIERMYIFGEIVSCGRVTFHRNA